MNMSQNDGKFILPVSENEMMRIVGDLALNLHMSHKKDLSCDLPAEELNPSKDATTDYIIDGNIIRFSSIETRNRIIANYLFEKYQNAFVKDSRMWLNTAHDLWRCEIGETDSAAGRLLALVHEVNDIFIIAASSLENGSMKVFNALHVIDAALPYLNKLEPDGIIKFCEEQHEQAKNDLVAGAFFSKLERTLITQPDVCRLIHEYCRNKITEGTINLYAVTLIALAKSLPGDAVRLAHEDAKSQNDILKKAALWTIGKLFASSYIAGDAMSEVSATILACISDSEGQTRRTAIHAAAQAIMMINAFDETLINLAEFGDQDVLAEIAYVLWLNILEMKNKNNFQKWVRLLCKLSVLSRGAIDHYDFILSVFLLNESWQQFTISCLTDWASANVKDLWRDRSVMELFKSTVVKLADHQELLSQIITDWLLSDNVQLAAAVSGLLEHLWVRGLKNPEFNIQRLNSLKQTDLLFLARRLLGFVSSEEHLISLTMSFLKIKDASQRTSAIVQSLFIDELGQDYPDSTIRALSEAKGAAMESEWMNFYSSIIEEISSRMDSINALPRLVELRPPPNLQRQFAMARKKQMNKTSEEAHEKSIVRQIFTEIPLKCGTGWFTFRDGKYSDSTHMQSFSHSVSVPCRYVLDTVGYDISHFFMRMAKRGEA